MTGWYHWQLLHPRILRLLLSVQQCARITATWSCLLTLVILQASECLSKHFAKHKTKMYDLCSITTSKKSTQLQFSPWKSSIFWNPGVSSLCYSCMKAKSHTCHRAAVALKISRQFKYIYGNCLALIKIEFIDDIVFNFKPSNHREHE